MAKRVRGNFNPELIQGSLRQGDNNVIQMFGGGTATAGHVLIYDANGNAIDGGAAGTVTHSTGALTADQPVFGNGGSDTKAGTKTGNTDQVVTATGSATSGYPLLYDANGNAIARQPRGNTTVVQLADSTTNPTAGNLTEFDANGNVKDSGIAASSVGGGNVTAAAALVSGKPAFGAGGEAVTTQTPRGNTTVVQLADSTTNPTSGNAASFDANGNIKDSGVAPAQNAAASAHKYLSAYNSATGAFTQAQPADTDLSVSDNTTNNVSTSAHGFAPKAPNNAAVYLDGTGNYSTPGPLTTKGDLFTFGTANTRLPVGTDGHVLTARSTATDGVDWETLPTATTSQPGMVQPDGVTVDVSSGVISVPTATTSALGLVKPDGSTITISGGVISAVSGGGGGSGGGVTYGTRASLPGTVPAAGTLYKCTDSPYEYLSNGSAWMAFLGGFKVTEPTLSSVSRFSDSGVTYTTTCGGLIAVDPSASPCPVIGLPVTPSTTLKVAVGWAYNLTNNGSGGAGCAIYNNNTGKVIIWRFVSSASNVYVSRVTVSTGSLISQSGPFQIWNPWPNNGCMVVRCDGTNVYLDSWFDPYGNVMQQNYWSESLSSFIGTNYTHIGLGLTPGSNCAVWLQHLAQVSA